MRPRTRTVAGHLAAVTLLTAGCGDADPREEPPRAAATASGAIRTPPTGTGTGTGTGPEPGPTAGTTAGTTAAAPAPAGSTATASTPAPAHEASVAAGRGDVVTRRPGHWFVPSIDVTRVDVAHVAGAGAGEDTVRFRIGFADLRPVDDPRGRVVQSLRILAEQGGRSVFLERRARRPASVVSQTLRGLLALGADSRRCGAARTTFDVDGDEAVLVLPVRCLATTRRPVRFTVTVQAAQLRDGGRTRPIGSDEVALPPLLLR